jgi:hypothetical protein
VANTQSWQELVGTVMQAADAYAKAYHKWHSEFGPENGDHERMLAARRAVHAAATSATGGVAPSDGSRA